MVATDLSLRHLNDFVQKNSENLQQLKKLSDGIEMVFNQHLKNEMDSILGILKEIDVEGQSSKVLMNETNIETIYKDINEKIGPLSLSFEEKVSKVMGPIDRIKDIASKIKSDNPRVGQSNVNEVLVAIDFFYVSLLLIS